MKLIPGLPYLTRKSDPTTCAVPGCDEYHVTHVHTWPVCWQHWLDHYDAENLEVLARQTHTARMLGAAIGRCHLTAAGESTEGRRPQLELRGGSVRETQHRWAGITGLNHPIGESPLPMCHSWFDSGPPHLTSFPSGCVGVQAVPARLLSSFRAPGPVHAQRAKPTDARTGRRLFEVTRWHV